MEWEELLECLIHSSLLKNREEQDEFSPRLQACIQHLKEKNEELFHMLTFKRQWIENELCMIGKEQRVLNHLKQRYVYQMRRKNQVNAIA